MIRRDAMTIWQDEEGAIIILWAVVLVVVLGLVALLFDFGQKAATQSELQSFADQVALAAAGELDGKSDAITRATQAAAALIVDQQTFGSGDRALSGAADYTLTFYRTLPGDDTASASAGATTSAAQAAFVEARVTPVTVPFTFLGAYDLFAGTSTANPGLGATAVAGFTQYACDITPLMFCIPSANFRAKDNIGKMILLRAGGNNAAWGPGDFGFLDPAGLQVDPAGPCAGLSGAQRTVCLIGASGALTQCFSQRGVNLEPGQKVGIENSAFNVRFDRYGTMLNSEKNNPVYAPAPNVISGQVPKSSGKGGGGGSACIGNNPDPSPNTVGLPRDTCFAAGTCGSGNRFGDGNWTAGRANYVTMNYGAGVTDPQASATTRYKYYLGEIASAGGGASTTRILPAGRAESGRPQCSSRQSSDPDRRVVVAAGIDCVANSIRGSASNVPVHEFVKLFLTEPVGNTSTFDMYVEIVDSAESGSGSGGTGGIFHDVVQLYR